MKRYRITLDDQTFDVRVLGDPRQSEVQVEVNGEIFTVGVEAPSADAEAATAEPIPKAAPATSAPIPSGPDAAVTAPLPGVVKSIAVQPGDEVAAGDPLLVIEAMKMNNVIRASRVGTIAALHISEGRQVAHGDLLLEFAD